jgi:hypothetical protein
MRPCKRFTQPGIRLSWRMLGVFMETVNRSNPSPPKADRVARMLMLLVLLLIAMAAISVVNWKVGRGVPVKTHRIMGVGVGAAR